ncbi:SDR family oxidoreductase [Brevibacterium aurantiacum]|uniref:SDR family oxidoreductase n=1 Tax=Brevibacterium aurantiacum TaxID=273384 RepID=UPI0021B1BC43|nr:SDR family oxidoreductase [Brevibacterium aurantiacum]
MSRKWESARVEIHLNNAGVRLFALLDAVTVDDFSTTFAVNVRGPLLLTQSLLPHRVDGAHVMNVSSSLSRHPSPVTAVYAASKTALEAIIQRLALELGPGGIPVDSVAPGPTATDDNGGAIRDDATMLAPSPSRRRSNGPGTRTRSPLTSSRSSHIPALVLDALQLGATASFAAAIVGIIGTGSLTATVPAGILVDQLGDFRAMLVATATAVEVLGRIVAAFL